MLTLYDYFRSSAAFRVRIALNYKGFAYQKHIINLAAGDQRQSQYQQLNPSGLIPCLINEDEQAINQSLAIIEYLEEQYPATPHLLPEDKLARSYVRSIALDIACDIHPLNNLRVLNYLRVELQQSEESVNHWYKHWISLGLASLEQKISASKFYTGKFCYGEQFTLADLCLIPQLYNARRFNCDLTALPTLLTIEQQCLACDWVIKALPDNQ